MRRTCALLLSVFVAACSGPDKAPAPDPAQLAAQETAARAAKELAMYEQLRSLQNYGLAAQIGEQIVQRYPTSAAATQVKQTLPDMQEKARTLGEKRRLEHLWTYQTSMESGAKQNTAALYASGEGDATQIRLILRRHAAWGQSTYLFGTGKGFECARDCTLAVKFDDGPVQRMKGSIPPTGEPAIFIEDDATFIARLEKAKTITFEVTPKGKAPLSARYEVGGYDPAKFPPLAKAAAPAKGGAKH